MKKPSQTPGKSQARKPNQANSNPKREQEMGKCRRCGSINYAVKECKVSANVECRNCKKTGHLVKKCANHIFSPMASQQKQPKKQEANLIEKGESFSSDDVNNAAQALAILRRVRNASHVYRC